MEEIKDSVIMVSIENAPKTHREGMKYLIDVPCKLVSPLSFVFGMTLTSCFVDPTAFHLSPSAKGPKPTVGNYFFSSDRPYLSVAL
jgi:hypothetical protein